MPTPSRAAKTCMLTPAIVVSSSREQSPAVARARSMQPACVHGLTDERTWEASAVVVPGKVALLRLIQPTLVDWACIPVRMLRHTA
eukprot:4994129-Prymnesium_polylepis.1